MDEKTEERPRQLSRSRSRSSGRGSELSGVSMRAHKESPSETGQRSSEARTCGPEARTCGPQRNVGSVQRLRPGRTASDDSRGALPEKSGYQLGECQIRDRMALADDSSEEEVSKLRGWGARAPAYERWKLFRKSRDGEDGEEAAPAVKPRYHEGMTRENMALCMQIDAERKYKAEMKWAADILDGTISPPKVEDAREYFEQTRALFSVFLPEKYHAGPVQEIFYPLRQSRDVVTSEAQVDSVWFIQRMDGLKIGPCGWRVGDKIRITAEAPDPEYNNYIALPMGVLPGERSKLNVDPSTRGYVISQALPDNTEWTRIFGSLARNSVWELRFSGEWLASWNQGALRRDPALSQRVEEAVQRCTIRPEPAPAGSPASAGSPAHGGVDEGRVCARRQHEEWRRQQPSEKKYNVGDKFRGFEFELPTWIPFGCEWAPDAEEGQGNYILVRSDPPGPAPAGPHEPAPAGPHEPAPAGPGRSSGPRVAVATCSSDSS